MNHTFKQKVKRLNETWDFLKKTHQSKWIQLENLNSKYASLNKGDLFFCEQNVSSLCFLLCINNCV